MSEPEHGCVQSLSVKLQLVQDSTMCFSGAAIDRNAEQRMAD